MKYVLKLTGHLLLLLAALWCLDRAVAGQSWPRFHRYALTRLDDTTTLDMVKDAASGKCHLIYRLEASYSRGAQTAGRAVTYLGEVPCDPIPVPPKVGDAPPASVIR